MGAYLLDPAACVRTLLQDCVTFRDFEDVLRRPLEDFLETRLEEVFALTFLDEADLLHVFSKSFE